MPRPSQPTRSTASSATGRGRGAAKPTQTSTPTPTPTPAAPPFRNTGGHDRFTEVIIHTAKCDKCNDHNRAKLHRCTTCGFQICTPCWVGKGGGAHVAPRRFRGPVFDPTAVEGVAASGSGNARTSVAASGKEEKMKVDVKEDDTEDGDVSMSNVFDDDDVEEDVKAESESESESEDHLVQPPPAKRRRVATRGGRAGSRAGRSSSSRPRNARSSSYRNADLDIPAHDALTGHPSAPAYIYSSSESSISAPASDTNGLGRGRGRGRGNGNRGTRGRGRAGISRARITVPPRRQGQNKEQPLQPAPRTISNSLSTPANANKPARPNEREHEHAYDGDVDDQPNPEPQHLYTDLTPSARARIDTLINAAIEVFGDTHHHHHHSTHPQPVPYHPYTQIPILPRPSASTTNPLYYPLTDAERAEMQASARTWKFTPVRDEARRRHREDMRAGRLERPARITKKWEWGYWVCGGRERMMRKWEEEERERREREGDGGGEGDGEQEMRRM
ncbi:hypothetical protein FQN53_008761 [Emmonsiellopsis sp. PD_33]|nr:hypothetical protein FQN53_008761 [Emmonsiellopsis sp. PD_33]